MLTIYHTLHKVRLQIIAFTAIISLSGCLDEKYDVLKQAHGRVDNILVVSQPQLWNSAVGDSFRLHFNGLFPVTPQPESLYDLRYLQYEELDKQQKLHRTILFLADLSDKTEISEHVKKIIGEEGVKRANTDSQYRIAIHNDRWASGQLIVYWFAPSRDALIESINLHYKNVMQNIQKHDDKTLTEMIYNLGVNQAANDAIKKQFNAEMSIPIDYTLAVQDSNAIWLRFETTKISSNIFIYQLPDSTILSPDNLRSLRNQISQKYFSTEEDSSYMQIDDRFLPVFYQTLPLNQADALQARGIWAMVNDFMGGSFVSYLVQDPKTKRTILIDGFVHAPGQQKRIEMRRLDLILSTFKLQ